MKKPLNRLAQAQPDYLLLIVHKPEGWNPATPGDVPQQCQVVSVAQVASYEEAYDDLVRCNELSMRHSLQQWAVIHSAGTDL